MKKLAPGFTLIELLVVIAIISLLASIVLGSLNLSRARARDARRLQDFHQFELALELFFQTYGVYPCGAGSFVNFWGGYFAGGTMSTTRSTNTEQDRWFLKPIVSIGNPSFATPCVGSSGAIPQFYSDKEVRDPLEIEGHTYVYLLTPDRKKYALLSALEGNNDLMEEDRGACKNYYERGPSLGEFGVSDINTPLFTNPASSLEDCIP